MGKICLNDILLGSGNSDDFVANGDIEMTGVNGFRASYDAAVTAAGNSQGTATTLSALNNVILTTPASAGVIIPSGIAGGMRFNVTNWGTNTTSVYPPSGHTILGSSVNQAFNILVSRGADFVGVGVDKWMPFMNSRG